MRKEKLNGMSIPYDLSLEKLEKMMSSSVMNDFSLACEALSNKNDPEAYRIMKTHINDRDKYRRLYVLKTIFRHREAVELVDFLEKAIMSEDVLFVENGLMIVSDYRIKVSEPLLISTVRKYCDELYTAVGALKMLAINEQNYEEIKSIFVSCTKCAQKEVLGKILCDEYLPLKAKELFELFKQDSFAKIRLLALEIGRHHGFDTSAFLSDTDGHIREKAK